MNGPVHLIVNPVGGSGRARRMRGLLEAELERLGVRYTLEETRARGEAAALARRAAENGAAAIYAVGGDGTVHEVANGLLSARLEGSAPRPALGLVPLGTGNDFAKLLGLSPRAPLQALRPGPPRHFDVGRVRWNGETEYFVNGMGTGVDVEVVRQMERVPRLRGVLGYLLAALRVLPRFQDIPLRLRLDGDELHRRLLLVAIMNGHCQGGGFHMCPAAAPDDGRLDLCLVSELGLLGRLGVLARVLRGTHVGHPAVTMLRARHIEIEPAADAAAPLYFQLDGELRVSAFGERLEVELLPGALTVLPSAHGPGNTVLAAGRDDAGASAGANRSAAESAGASAGEGTK